MAIKFKNKVAPFQPERLEPIAKAIADTEHGLTGSEIGHILAQCKISDPAPSTTKWKRLYSAFAEFQNKHQVGNHVVVFLGRAMDPARYTANPSSFGQRQDALKPILALCGMSINDSGKVRRATRATTLDDALERANRFQGQLRKRNVHGDVLRYCSAEILSQNYFHAVFEAMKSLSAKIRQLSDVDAGGQRLVDRAFSLGSSGIPILAINNLATETQRGEQRGFVSLLKGLYGTIRNPLAHEPKQDWDMSEQDALDIMSMISLVHRKLDNATRTPATQEAA